MDDSHLTGHPAPGPDSGADLGGYPAMSPRDTILAAALAYISHGWPIFPCQMGGKRPVVRRGFLAASLSQRQILNWFEGEFAAHNIGIPTGAHTFDALDVEGTAKPGGSGFPALRRLKEAGLLAGAFRMVRTPSDGLHLYYRGTSQGCGSLRAAHIDYKSAGGYVLVPPSYVVESRFDRRDPATGYYEDAGYAGRYEVVDDRAPTGGVFRWEAARQLLCPPPPYRAPRKGRGGSTRHLPDWLAGQPEGARNDGLFWASCRAIEAGDEQVLDDLADVALASGLTGAEVYRTIRSAMRKADSSDGR